MKNFIYILLLLAACSTTTTPTTPEQPTTGGGSETEAPTKPTGPITVRQPSTTILSIADNSTCAAFSWADRGKAPISYIRGMAATYEKAVCDLRAGKEATESLAKALSTSDVDALAHYGLPSSTKEQRLRSLFSLMIGLGMRESSGKWCVGRDMSATNYTASTCEAGIMQSSYNSVSGPVRQKLYVDYKVDRSACFFQVFAKNVTCKQSDYTNWGSGEGVTFQALSKECPAYAIEHAGLNLRVLRKHYGPINRKEAQVYSGCTSMLEKIEQNVSCETK